MGKAIVTTRLGGEGIEAGEEREWVLAGSPGDFARQVLGLLADPPRRRRLGTAARRFVEQRYDWRVIVPALEANYLK